MNKKEPGKPATKFAIDFEGIDQRIIALPLPTGNYANLQAGSGGQVFVISRPDR